MKKGLMLGALLLGCCLAAAAQIPSTEPGAENQTAPQSTPSTLPQEQLPSTVPGAENQTPSIPDQNTTDQATLPSSSQATTIQGCLSKSPEGNFMLADISGNRFQLSGDRSQLKQLDKFVGTEVKVDGMAMTNDSAAGAMSSNTSSGSDSVTSRQFNVNKVRRVASACGS